MQSVVETIIEASNKIVADNTTIENLNTQIAEDDSNFDGIYDAIVDKGQSPTKTDRTTYAPAIEAISGANLDSLSVTPSTAAQVITPTSPYDGFDEVDVAAVDHTIDANIVAGNIKKDVEILGVVGSYEGGSTPTLQTKTVTPSSSDQVVEPDQGYDGLSEVTVYGDSDLVAGNIKKDVVIFGVTGSYEGGGAPSLQNKTVNPSTSQQTVQADSGYDGLDTVTVNAVTSSIDNNIQSGNIKKDVVILGVTGSYEGGSTPVLESKTVTPDFSSGDVVVEPDQGYDGLEDVTITKDSDLIASNIKSGVEIFGITGNYSAGGTLDDIYDEFVQLAHTYNLNYVNGLVCIDDTLYMYNSRNIYRYDATNDSWTEIVNNVGNSGVDKNAAVAIGSKIVWAWHDSWEDIYYKYYDVDTQTLSNNISISLQGQLSAIETDGTYLYVFDYKNSRIIKIDIANNTKTYFSISVSERITTLKWFHEKLYGITKTYIYEIDVDAETCTVAYTFGSTPSYDRDVFVSGAGMFISAGVDVNSADAFKIYVFDGTNVTLYKTTTDIYFRNGTYCICDRKLYQLGGNDINPDSFTNKFSEIGDNMSITLVITPSQNGILSSFTDEMANVFVKGVTAEVDSDIIAENIKNGVNILGCVGTYTGDGSTNKTYNFIGEYADRSPVEYEWTVNDIVSHVNIKNVNTGQDTGTWNQVSKSNTTIYIKRSSSGSYETLSSNDWDLVNTGTGSANYYYNIDFDLDEYISAIKIVYDGVYRVSAVTTVQARSMTYYGTSAPVSSTGYEDGDYYCVYEDYTVSNTVVRKIISQYILISGTWTQIA